MRAVVVARHSKHAAVLRCAQEIAAVERIASAIDAGTFTVPHAVHAIDALARERIELLRPVQHCRSKVLVHAGLELNIALGQQLLAAPQFLIQSAQRRTAIAGNKTAGVQTGGAIEAGLFQQDADERLYAGKEHRRVEVIEPAFQRDWGMAETNVHPGFSPKYPRNLGALSRTCHVR